MFRIFGSLFMGKKIILILTFVQSNSFKHTSNSNIKYIGFISLVTIDTSFKITLSHCSFYISSFYYFYGLLRRRDKDLILPLNIQYVCVFFCHGFMRKIKVTWRNLSNGMFWNLTIFFFCENDAHVKRHGNVTNVEHETPLE